MMPRPATRSNRQSRDIVIVFLMGGDPVKMGLVVSLNRPGGNVTGMTFLTNVLGAKRLELLHELVPAATTLGFLINPTGAFVDLETTDIQAAVRALRPTGSVRGREQRARNRRPHSPDSSSSG
jgi:putative tryptophan/tyrosine transport system substrate-binding protein